MPSILLRVARFSLHLYFPEKPDLPVHLLRNPDHFFLFPLFRTAHRVAALSGLPLPAGTGAQAPQRQGARVGAGGAGGVGARGQRECEGVSRPKWPHGDRPAGVVCGPAGAEAEVAKRC